MNLAQRSTAKRTAKLAQRSPMLVVGGIDWVSRLLLLGTGGAKLDLLPLNLTHHFLAMTDIDAVGQLAITDGAVIRKTQFTTVVGGVSNHLHREQLLASGIERETQIGHVARSEHDFRWLGLAFKRRCAVINDVAEFLGAFDKHLPPQVQSDE